MFWDKMLILKNKEEDNNDLIISQQRPLFFAMDKNFKFDLLCMCEKTLTIDKKTLDEISNFYLENNLMSTGNINMITPDILMKYINHYSELVVIKNKNKIIGSILSLRLPIRLKTDKDVTDIVSKTQLYNKLVPNNSDGKTLLFGCTTFLNNHKKYRAKGLGMVLIQKSLQIAYDDGMLCAYFLNTKPRCSNSVPIKNWLFPVNPDNLDKYRIDYPRKYRSSYFIKLSENYSVILVDNSNIKESLDLYLKLMSDKKFYMYPDINFWKEFTKNHKVYMVKFDGEYIGIFSIDKLNVNIPSKKCNLDYGHVLFCVGKQPEIIKTMIYTSNLNNYDLLMLQECGDINRYFLNMVMAINTGHTDYLNFYNCRIKLSPSEIYSPLL